MSPLRFRRARTPVSIGTALLLWASAVASVAGIAQACVIHWVQGVGWLETFAGLWVELGVLVPAGLLLGLLGMGLQALSFIRGGDPEVAFPRLLVPAGLSGMALWLGLAHAPGPTPTTGRPDVIVLMIDTLRQDFVDDERTPQLAALRDESVVFTQAVSAAPWTLPAVASMLTGQYPEQHGAYRNPPIHAEAPTLAEHLRRAGYGTVGLVSNPHLSTPSGLQRGFDYYQHITTWELPYGLATAFAFRTPHALAGLQRRRASLAARFVRDAQRPWFLFLHLMDPHLPLNPERHFVDAERDAHPDATPDRIQYGAALRSLDVELGRYFEGLRSSGQYDRSIIAVLSDHGEEIDDGRTWEDDRDSARHGHSLLPELIRVPMSFRLPGGAHAGRCDAVVSTRRLAATVLALAGADATPLGEPLLDTEGHCSDVRPMTYQSALWRGPDQVASRDDGRTVIVERKALRWSSYDRIADPEHRAQEPTAPQPRKDDLEQHLREVGAPLGSEVPTSKAPDAIDPMLQKQLRAMGYAE